MTTSSASLTAITPPSEEILKCLWNRTSGQLINGNQLSHLCHSAYFDYYWAQWEVYVNPSWHGVLGFRDVVEVLELLRADATREDILTALRLKLKTPLETENLDGFVNLAARLLLMLEVGVLKGEINPRRYLTWTGGSIKTVIGPRFKRAHSPERGLKTLPKSFDAWSIHSVAGIKIHFTDNLMDHLLLINGDTEVLVFHHASFLECHVHD